MIQMKKILLPTDFSGPASLACKYACALTEQFDAELHLLHVYDVPVSPVFFPEMAYSEDTINELEQKASQSISELLDPEWKKDKKVVGSVIRGISFVEIIRYAKKNEIDLMVIGTHGRTALSHALMGSVAEKIVRKAPCPVLTVRPGEHEFVMP